MYEPIMHSLYNYDVGLFIIAVLTSWVLKKHRPENKRKAYSPDDKTILCIVAVILAILIWFNLLLAIQRGLIVYDLNTSAIWNIMPTIPADACAIVLGLGKKIE